MHASSGAAEQLVEGCLLALADGVLVQDPVRSQVAGGRRGVGARAGGGGEAGYGRQGAPLRVEHFGHRQAVPEAVVQGRQNWECKWGSC